LFTALLALFSSMLGFAGVEVVARRLERRLALRPQHGGGLDLAQANPHGTGSYRLKPNLDVHTWVKSQAVTIRTNSLGMRWREVAREKPVGKRRVAFLGDSFAFGCWTPSVDTSFVGVFEHGLNPRRMEALNFGVGGYGLDDMELLLREEVLSFAPDWVIVTVFTGNDFRDTYLGIDKHQIVDGTAVVRDEVVAAKVPAEFLQAPYAPPAEAADPWRMRALLKRTATFRLLLPALGWDNPWIEFKVHRKFMGFTFWSQQPPPGVVLRARDQVLATLERMDAVVRAQGARLAVVTIPSREQVYCRVESGPDFDVQFPQVWVRVFAREHGIPYLDLWAPLREHALATAEQVYLADDIHFDERGHALAGEWIRAWFQAEVRPLVAPEGEGN
jgi:lysophospholipase L1-like esterase